LTPLNTCGLRLHPCFQTGRQAAIALVAFPGEAVAYFKHRGMALRLINRTEEVAAFAACDSRLFIVREALDSEGRWREVESPPVAIRANSFHRVFLKPSQYWQFPAGYTAGRFRPRRDSAWTAGTELRRSTRTSSRDKSSPFSSKTMVWLIRKKLQQLTG